MSVRGYFDRRDAIPGFTFILVILLLNFHPIYLFLKSEANFPFGALLGFFTLFSGSAIGFIVSQFWWWCFQANNAQYQFKKCDYSPVQKLINKYGLKDDGTKKTIQNILSVYGYVTHYEGSRKKGAYAKIFDYTTRRWDLYHLLSSTVVSIIMAFIVTFIVRLVYVLAWLKCFELSFYKIHIENYLFGSTIEFFSLIFIICFLFLLIYGTLFSMKWVLGQYNRVSYALIQNSKLTPENVRDVFPSDFFDNSSEPAC